jgi:glycosyltransferase involved in cell wall biosynthesis
MKNITVLFISHYTGTYGANQSLCTLMLELREKYGIRTILLLPSYGPVCSFLTKNGINYYISHYYWWVNSDKGLFQKILNYRKQLRNLYRIKKLVQIFKNEKIDIVYSNSITINIGYWLSKKLDCPHIWHIRETMNAYEFKFSIGEFLAKRFLKAGADKYIAISDFVFNSYSRLLPVHKLQRVYNGLDIGNEFQIAKIFLGILNICIVGIVCEQKNQLDALSAIKILVYKRGITNIKLHIVGSAKEDYLDEIKSFIELNLLQDYVVMAGHQSDMNTYLKEMNVGLVCARDEAFGRVSVEYMLHCLPVIASISGANVELIKDGHNGLLYNIYNPDELANKIEYFIKTPSQITKMGLVARDYAMAKFPLEMNTRAIYNIIGELICNK